MRIIRKLPPQYSGQEAPTPKVKIYGRKKVVKKPVKVFHTNLNISTQKPKKPKESISQKRGVDQHKLWLIASIAIVMLALAFLLFNNQGTLFGKAIANNPPPPACFDSPSGLQWMWKGSSFFDRIGFKEAYATNVQKVAGDLGVAYGMNGNGYLTTLPANVGPLGSFTYEFWINVDESSATSYFVDSDLNYGEKNGVPRFSLMGSAGKYSLQLQFDNAKGGGIVNLPGTVTITPGISQHIAMVRDVSQGKFFLYVNGIQSIIFNDPGYELTLPFPKFGGSASDCPGRDCMVGYFDEISIYSRAITKEEILDIYVKGKIDGLGKCFPTKCGNEYFEIGEECEEGNILTESCAYGLQSCDVCSSTCTIVSGATSFCGDNIQNGDEECDSGPGCVECKITETALQCLPYPGLVSHWPFDDVEGGITKDIQSSHEGTVIDSKIVLGKFENSLEFDGVNDYVEIPHSPDFDFSTAFSVSVWFNIDTLTKNQGLVYKGPYNNQWGTWSLNYAQSGNVDGLKFILGNAGTIVNGKVPTSGVWHHVVATYDGINAILYLDGVLDSSTSVISPLLIGNHPIHLGRYYGDSTNRYFDGKMDDLMVFNKALTASEVINLFNEGESGFCLGESLCGNSIIEDGETCDDGNAETEICDYGLRECDVCDAICSLGPGHAQYCGNSFLEQSEQCDDGNNLNDDGCSSTCETESRLQLDQCLPQPAGLIDLWDGGLVTDDTIAYPKILTYQGVPSNWPTLGKVVKTVKGTHLGILHWQGSESQNPKTGTFSYPYVDGEFLPSVVEDEFGKAFNINCFDGLTYQKCFVRIPHEDSLNPKHITIATWVKSTGSLNPLENYQFVSKSETYDYQNEKRVWHLQTGRNTNSAEFLLWLEGSNTPITVRGISGLSDGRWHFLVASYDGSVAKLYVDGKLEGSVGASGTLNFEKNDIYIGKYEESNKAMWPGLIDEVQLYDRALSGPSSSCSGNSNNEVCNIYLVGKNGFSLCKDSDKDSIPDEQDNCPVYSNVDQADSDLDGVGDKCDNCRTISNKDQADTDILKGMVTTDVGDKEGYLQFGDKVGDSCDICPFVYDYEQSDKDGDGKGDSCDSCPLHSDLSCTNTVTNIDFLNLEFNYAETEYVVGIISESQSSVPLKVMLSDAELTYSINGLPEYKSGNPYNQNINVGDTVTISSSIFTYNINIACGESLDICAEGRFCENGACTLRIQDSDNDEYADDVDNCPDDFNPGQQDSDGDLFGDVCDFCPNFADDGDSDCPCSAYNQEECPESLCIWYPFQEQCVDSGAVEICTDFGKVECMGKNNVRSCNDGFWVETLSMACGENEYCSEVDGLFAGCLEIGTCTVDNHCLDDQKCFDNECLSSDFCINGDDCSSGFECVNNVCIESCSNGAVNPPLCNGCASGYYYDGVSCVPLICVDGETRCVENSQYTFDQCFDNTFVSQNCGDFEICDLGKCRSMTDKERFLFEIGNVYDDGKISWTTSLIKKASNVIHRFFR
jgi:cysteine-rich repeat protein